LVYILSIKFALELSFSLKQNQQQYKNSNKTIKQKKQKKTNKQNK
jgi:hypothetical protein